jgi:hypothetical protein
VRSVRGKQQARRWTTNPGRSGYGLGIVGKTLDHLPNLGSKGDRDRLPSPDESAPKPTAEAGGFKLRVFVSYGAYGDAWIEAPDRAVATLIWDTGSPAYFVEKVPPGPGGRWGLYAVRLALPLTTDSEAEIYLRALLPDLIPRWLAWRVSLRETSAARSPSD